MPIHRNYEGQSRRSNGCDTCFIRGQEVGMYVPGTRRTTPWTIDATIAYCFDNSRGENSVDSVLLSVGLRTPSTLLHETSGVQRITPQCYANFIVARNPSEIFRRILDFEEFELVSRCTTTPNRTGHHAVVTRSNQVTSPSDIRGLNLH